MQYSPKLKKAMEEMKKILRKYDIAGSIVLHTPGHVEFLNHIDPSYSLAFYEFLPGGQTAVRIRSRLKEDFKGDKEKQKQMTNDTVNMISNLATIVGRNALVYIELEEMIKKKVEIIYREGGITGHDQQNN